MLVLRHDCGSIGVPDQVSKSKVVIIKGGTRDLAIVSSAQNMSDFMCQCIDVAVLAHPTDGRIIVVVVD